MKKHLAIYVDMELAWSGELDQLNLDGDSIRVEGTKPPPPADHVAPPNDGPAVPPLGDAA